MNLLIQLESNPPFLAGQHIIGTLVLSSDTRISATSIRLNFQGQERTHFNINGPTITPLLSHWKDTDSIVNVL